MRSYWYVIAPTQSIYYNGDKFPELKDKFLVGTFGGGGNIHPLKFDKDNKYIIEDDVIRFNQYPYVANFISHNLGDGNVYYGAYDIYRLQSINSDYKRQILFPIQINTTNKVYVKDLQINQDEKKRTMTIDLAYNSTSRWSYSQVITLKYQRHS